MAGKGSNNSNGIRVLKLLQKEIEKKYVEPFTQFCRRKFSLGRGQVEGVGKDISKLFDILCKCGIIKENNWKPLVDALAEFEDTEDVSTKLVELLEELGSKPEADRSMHLRLNNVSSSGDNIQTPGCSGLTSPLNSNSISSSGQIFKSPTSDSKKRRFSAAPMGDSGETVEPDTFDNDLPYYDLEFRNGKKGLVFVVSNSFQNLSGFQRRGAEFDVDYIRKCFESRQSYKVVVYTDVNKERFDKLLEQLKTETEGYSCLLMFIMTHGCKEGLIMDHKDEDEKSSYLVPLDEVIRSISSMIQGKPKALILQACQGDGTEDVSPDAERPLTQPPNDDDDEDDEDEQVFEDSDDRIKSINYSDVLIGFPTWRGEKAYRGKRGTWYIQALINVISQYKHHHLLDILTEVNRLVCFKKGKDPERKEVRQMPYLQSTLRKRFYLFPQSF